MSREQVVIAQDLADWFLSRVDRDSGDVISHLKLQKLIYYAQAWYLANYNKSLFQEEIQAWAHGPVAPSLWQQYKDAGWSALPIPEVNPKLDGNTSAFLEKVMNAYGKYEAKFLEELTHKELPWKKIRGNLAPFARCTKIIPKMVMRDYYAKKIKRTWTGAISTD